MQKHSRDELMRRIRKMEEFFIIPWDAISDYDRDMLNVYYDKLVKDLRKNYSEKQVHAILFR